MSTTWSAFVSSFSVISASAMASKLIEATTALQNIEENAT